jgi:pimeloyl-ACP methyl ester carboxylesterase
MVRHYKVAWLSTLAGLALLAMHALRAEETAPANRVATGEAEARESEASPVTASLLRLSSKTLGGEQFWADEFIHGGWRIQRNVVSGHYRLLDPDDYRRAFGSYETCQEKFESLRISESIPDRKKRAVVMLHGLIRSRDTMVPLGEHLAKHGDYEVVNVTYPSTRGTVADHAASLGKVLERLDGVEEVNFVAHSMGNLVIRHWMADHCGSDVEEENRQKFKVGRFVMLGPPNNGAVLATTFKRNTIFRMVVGQSGKQLALEWDDLCGELCVPPCEFGILAGAAAVPNPLIAGDNDLIVGVEEAKLPGAADFRLLPLSHARIRDDEEVAQMTLHFLQHGSFEGEEQRMPITTGVDSSERIRK